MNISFEHTWRWFGPEDPITLADIKQTGATAIVTALHHIPNGEIWSVLEINKRKNEIEAAGLSWSVVESVPIHEAIKTKSTGYLRYIDTYKQTLSNLAECGIDIVCYNFMPVLDWTRTDLHYLLENGRKALRFNATAFAAFELFILKRVGAENSYSAAEKNAAKNYYDQLSEKEKQQLTNTIIAGLPGAEEDYSLDEFSSMLATYDAIDTATLKRHLFEFLNHIIPAAEQAGVLMCIHPDDPPFSILGLPRVVSTEQDIVELYEAVDSLNNGLTFCTGSFGVRKDNDLPGMIERLGERIHFIHLRNTKRDTEGSFHEASHLDGDVDMYAVIKALVTEQKKRIAAGRKDMRMPLRPDHGHQMLDDLRKKTNPGYTAIGRLKGLAELRGLEYGIRKSFVQ